MKRCRFGVIGLGIATMLVAQVVYAQNSASGSPPAATPAPAASPATATAPPDAAVGVSTSDASSSSTGTVTPTAPAVAPIENAPAATKSELGVEALRIQNAELETRIARLEEKQRSLENLPSDKRPSGVQVIPYGFVKLGVAYDTSRTAFGDLAFYVLPDSKPGGGKRELTFGARESRIGLKLSAPEFAGIVATGQFEADWAEEVPTPSKYSPRLRLAFVDLAFGAGWALRAGQDWDLYVVAQPKIVDASILGATGHVYGRRPQVKLTKLFKLGQTSSVTVKLGAAHGRTQDLDSDGQLDADAAGVPSIQGGLVLATTLLSRKPTILSISGAYGKEKVHLPLPTATTPPNHTKTFDTTLVHGSLQFPLADSFALQGVVWWGKNVDQYYGGVLQGINAGAESEIEAFGGWGQVTWDATYAWSLSAGVGADDPVNADVAAGGRTFNGRAFGNLFFKATRDALVVLEYGYMKTRAKAESSATNHRTQLAFQYTF
ncbi:MAG TPA: hypothetical protein VIV60_36590 [Polyangiaceae bacterium]